MSTFFFFYHHSWVEAFLRGCNENIKRIPNNPNSNENSASPNGDFKERIIKYNRKNRNDREIHRNDLAGKKAPQ